MPPRREPRPALTILKNGRAGRKRSRPTTPLAAPKSRGYNKLFARVAELADALDLGSSTERCVGSNPSSRNTQHGNELPRQSPAVANFSHRATFQRVEKQKWIHNTCRSSLRARNGG